MNNVNLGLCPFCKTDALTLKTPKVNRVKRSIGIIAVCSSCNREIVVEDVSTMLDGSTVSVTTKSVSPKKKRVSR